MSEQVEKMLQALDLAQPKILKRDQYYRGTVPLRFAADKVEGDLRFFHTNLCRVAVQALAERLRLKRIDAMVDGVDASERARGLWLASNMDQLLQSVLADALAVGSAYLIVWVDAHGRPTVTVESAEHVISFHDPINRAVTGAVKRWFEKDHQGVVVNEHVVEYRADKVTHFVRGGHGRLEARESFDNPLGVVPVVPLINVGRVTDPEGYSVLDDLGSLVDMLSKLLADMITASEAVARPRRWATGVDLEENDGAGFMADGFTADALAPEPLPEVKAPFSDDDKMWIAEDDRAKFGQLPGADLGGYKTAVDLVLQQIMSVSALPAHMVGVTSNQPASADAIRAAEASLTARAESRTRVFGLPIEQAVRLLVAADAGVDPSRVDVSVKWADPATRSQAQEADAITKLHSLGIVTTNEAREMFGFDAL